MPDDTPDTGATRRRKLQQTVYAVAITWGVLWTVGYASLTSKGEGPGDLQSWLLAGLLAWGPLGALEVGRVWLGWYRAPE